MQAALLYPFRSEMKHRLTLCPNDPEKAVVAMREAAARLIRQGMPLWSLDELTLERLRQRYPGCDLLSFWLAGELAGGVVITKEAPAYWPPEIPVTQAVYISKLSVTDAFVGRKISARILSLIHAHYAKSGYHTARLDCDAERPKLNRVYLDAGYRLIHHSVVMERFPTNFYQRAI